VGPLRGRAAAVELLEQLNSLFGLRHCARKLPRRYWPSAYGQMGRCLSPCLGDLDPNLYRRRLDQALALFTGEGDGGAALLAHLDEQMRGAAAEQNFERAAWLRRRRERLAWLLERLGGVLAATHARPRLVLAEHPRGGRCDAFWLVGGRVVDWGPPGDLDEVMERTVRALRGGDGTGATACLAPDEVDEARIVSTWLDAHDAPVLDLHGGADRAAVARLLASAHEDGHAHPGRVQRADDPVGAGPRQPPREHAA
jgi:DNA polymerase-3 subunit epsilon